jgi:hypothetical protein
MFLISCQMSQYFYRYTIVTNITHVSVSKNTATDIVQKVNNCIKEFIHILNFKVAVLTTRHPSIRKRLH